MSQIPERPLKKDTTTVREGAEPFRLSAEAKHIIRLLVASCVISFIALAWMLLMGMVEVNGRFWWFVSIVGTILIVSLLLSVVEEA